MLRVYDKGLLSVATFEGVLLGKCARGVVAQILSVLGMGLFQDHVLVFWVLGRTIFSVCRVFMRRWASCFLAYWLNWGHKQLLFALVHLSLSTMVVKERVLELRIVVDYDLLLV